jgi:hypothetical protein
LKPFTYLKFVLKNGLFCFLKSTANTFKGDDLKIAKLSIQ